MEIKGDSSERRKVRGVDEAVEEINRRPHENFTVYDATQDIINEIRRRVSNTIKEG